MFVKRLVRRMVVAITHPLGRGVGGGQAPLKAPTNLTGYFTEGSP